MSGWWGFLGSSVVKESACQAGDLSLIPGLGRSPGGENGNPVQYSCLGNPMDRGVWRAIVHGVTKSQTRLSKWTAAASYLAGDWQACHLRPWLGPFSEIPAHGLLLCSGLPSSSQFPFGFSREWASQTHSCLKTHPQESHRITSTTLFSLEWFFTSPPSLRGTENRLFPGGNQWGSV